MMVLRNLVRHGHGGTLPGGIRFDLAPRGSSGDCQPVAAEHLGTLRSLDLGAYGLGLAYVADKAEDVPAPAPVSEPEPTRFFRNTFKKTKSSEE